MLRAELEELVDELWELITPMEELDEDSVLDLEN